MGLNSFDTRQARNERFCQRFEDDMSRPWTFEEKYNCFENLVWVGALVVFALCLLS